MKNTVYYLRLLLDRAGINDGGELQDDEKDFAKLVNLAERLVGIAEDLNQRVKDLERELRAVKHDISRLE